MENDFTAIHNMLVEQMKKLSDDKLCNTEDKLKLQADRAKALCGLTSSVVSLSNTQIRALEVKEEYGLMFSDLPEQLNAGN